MIGMRPGVIFFDPNAVIRKADQAERRVLRRFGAFVRRRARTSIRKSKRISKPGQPPKSHTGRLRRLIVFGYAPATGSVVIGPLPFRGTAVAPRLLEEGGRVTRASDSGRTRTLQYRRRPYMGPAFHKELNAAPKLWRDAIR